jgi:hypothetical protein
MEHLEGDELINLRIDRGAHRVVVVAFRHFGVPRSAAGFCEPVHDFLRDSAHHVPFRHARKSLPQVVIAVQRGAALHHRSARIAPGLDQRGLRPLPRRRDRRHHTGGAAARHHHVETPHRQFLRGLFVEVAALGRSAARRGSEHQYVFGKTSPVHGAHEFIAQTQKGCKKSHLSALLH